MMPPQTAKPDYAWEKEHAPRIPRGYWYAVVALFVLWVIFLIGMAVHRWVLTLQ